MRVMRKGQQLHPDDWSAVGMPPPASDCADVPETVHVETGEPVCVVRFTDTTTVTTAAAMCASMGVGLDAYREAMAALVSSGWLTLLEDGTYAATIPEPEDWDQ